MGIFKNGNKIAIDGTEFEALKQLLENEFQDKYILWDGVETLVTTVLNRLYEMANGKINLVLAEELPATTEPNTQYWVESYNGTVLTDARHIIVTDSLNVATYVGTTAVDFDEYQKKEDNSLQTVAKTIVGAINEVNQKSGGNLYYYQKSITDTNADSMVFDFTPNDWTSGQLEVVEKRITSAWMYDPITNDQRYGTVETTQFFHTGRNYIYIKQYFKTIQYALRNARMEFYRQAYVELDSASQYTNWVAAKKSSITWLDWCPYEYPSYNIANIPISGKGQFSYIMISISGGNMTMRGIWSASSGSLNVQTEVMTFPFKIKIGGGITTYYDKFPNEALTGTIDAIFDNQNKFYVRPTATGDFRICSTIPLGY